MKGTLRALASLRLTPFVIALLAGGVLASYRLDWHAGWVVGPLLVLAVHLLCAILVTPQFRRSAALLVFHVCLLGVALLALAGELAQFEGRVELAEGQQVAGHDVTVVRRGPWHPAQALDAIAFTQGPVRVEFTRGLFRQSTRSVARVPGAGAVHFGDNVPLRLGGYRLYTTSNKGYSASLTWRDPLRGTLTGVINFPSFPFYDWNQVNAWTAPDGSEIVLELHLQRPPRERDWAFEAGYARSAGLTVRVGERSYLLRPGEEARLGEARLRYDGTRTWMGYEIYYNPLLAWLFATALVGVLSLAWHYVTKFRPTAAAARALDDVDGVARS